MVVVSPLGMLVMLFVLIVWVPPPAKKYLHFPLLEANGS